MGCDITGNVEIKIKGQWHNWSPLRINRWYKLFGKIAGVRSDEADPIVEPRGLPDDISIVTRLAYERDADDAHHQGWLTVEEATAIEDWYVEEAGRHSDYEPIFGWLLGNNLNDFERYKSLSTDKIEDVRVVFWFTC